MLRCKLIWMVLLLGVVGCRPTQAGLKPGDDRAHLFSPEAIQEADFEIRDLKARYRKDLKIETFATVPLHWDVLRNLDKKDEAYRDQFFASRAHERAVNIDGIYVLICQDRVQVEVTRATAAHFSAEDASRLRDIFAHNQNADDGLREGVTYVANRLEANLRP